MAVVLDEAGQLLKEVLTAKGGMQPILDSLNYFYRFKVPKILASKYLITNNGKYLTFSNPVFIRPTINDLKGQGGPRSLFPYEARRMHLSYMAGLKVTIELKQNINGSLVPIPGERAQVFLGKVPVAIGSYLCHTYGLTPEERYQRGEPKMDAQGYFIVKGDEKVLLNIEKLRTLSPFLYEEKGDFIVRYTSQTLMDSSVIIVTEDEYNVVVTFTRIGLSNNLNIFHIFYVLGLVEDTVRQAYEIMESFIVDENPAVESRRKYELRSYLLLTENSFLSEARASKAAETPEKEAEIRRSILDKILSKFRSPELKNSEYRYRTVVEIIRQDLFKNIPYNENQLPAVKHSYILSKIRLLAYMVVKYVEFKTGYRSVDDRDDWGNKQLTDPGRHLANRFIKIWESMIETAQNKIRGDGLESAANISKVFNPNYMTEQFITSLVRPRWGTQGREITVVEPLKRDNLVASWTHLRRVNTPTNRQALIRSKRLIHNSQWGVMCPIMTPEGEACGLVKDSAITIYTSLDRDEALVLSKLEKDYRVLPDKEFRNPLFVNGAPVGFCKASDLYQKLVHLRRTQQIYFDTGIILNKYKELWVYTNEGRICRPLLTVDLESQELLIDKLKLRGTDLNTLLSRGALEYLDVAEQVQPNILISQSSKHLQERNQRIKETLERSYSVLENPQAPESERRAAEAALDHVRNEIRYTHCEIDPTAILGLSAVTMPFAEFNPAPRGTYQCLHPDSLVTMADRTLKPIKNIEVGDKILSFNPRTLEISPTKVINHFLKWSDKPMLKVTDQNGKSIICTYDHLFMTKDGWVKAQNLENTLVLKLDQDFNPFKTSFIRIKSVEPTPRTLISDLTTESKNHTFFAEGFGVHNSSMVRQALGPNSARIELRFDNTIRTIVEPGVPVVTTAAHEWLGLDEFPQGQQIILAITTYGGENQEDAIIFNKDAIDRGLFMMMIYNSYTVTVCQSKGRQEKIQIPDYPPSQAYRYSKLDPATGIVRVGETIKPNDCLVGKIIIETATGQVSNASLYAEPGKIGVVDEVYITENIEACRLIRIRLRELRKPKAGDKFASRYSQKGTIGAVIPGHLFPWISSEKKELNGVRPHAIFNPHSIPSRMTVGKLYEILTGKLAVLKGERVSATAFRRFRIESVQEELQSLGFSRTGKEKMVNGITGREMDVEIFIGPVYYQLLRHLVDDKMQARGTGAVQFLTRQPNAGIRKEGGLRFGEMERDALIEYGASYLTQDRLIFSSDVWQGIVCRKCGQFAVLNIEQGVFRCRFCREAGEYTRVQIPYAFKLLNQYLAAANIKLKLVTKEA